MLDQIYKDRLLHLANFLETIPDEHFDLFHIIHDRNWCEENSTIIEKLQAILDKKEVDCGAVACGIGWMPGAFPDRFKWDKDSEVIDIETNRITWAAANIFFGLSGLEVDIINIKNGFESDIEICDSHTKDASAVDYLFFPDHYVMFGIEPSKENLIKRIRLLVSKL